MFSGDPTRVIDAARSAEALGFDGVFAFDHLFAMGGPPERPALEPLACLAAVAAVTSRIALGTLVARALLRSPALLAWSAATLDQVSGGRTVLGVGSGDADDEPEHRMFGFPSLGTRDRRTHLAETVEALRALFDGRPYPGGDRVPAMAGPLLPPPVRPGGPPVWVAGRSDELVRLAARLADGWNGWGLDAEAFGRSAALLRREAEAAGRTVDATWAGIVLVGETDEEATSLLEARRARGMADPAWTGSAAGLAAFLRSLAGAGASWAVVMAAGAPGRRELLAERVLPLLA